MKKHLEYNDNKSHKFWKIEVFDNTFTVTYGKIGTDGQSKTKEFETDEKVAAEAEKLVKQKLKKGYVEIAAPDKTSNTPKEIDYYQELIKFDKEYGSETYSDTFCIADNEDDFFKYWLSDCSEEQLKEHEQNLQIFAMADGSGGRYAFWFTDENKDPNKSPIIYYGSEGEIHLIASDIKDLIQILSFGVEISEDYFYRSCDEEDHEDEEDCFSEYLEYHPNFLTFRKWMQEKLNIEPVKDWKIEGQNTEVEKLTKKASEKHKENFDKWQHQIYPNPND